MPFADVPIKTYLQRTVPDAFRGRINAIYHTLWMSMMPLGMVGMGYTISQVGIGRAFFVMGALMIGTIFIGFAGREFWLAKMPDTPVEDPSVEAKEDEVTRAEELVVR